jgi:hypothetical protein
MCGVSAADLPEPGAKRRARSALSPKHFGISIFRFA